MYAISVRLPWTWYLLWAGKDIENRGLRFPRKYRGRILLHASKWWNETEMLWDVESANGMWAQRPTRAQYAPQLTLRNLHETRGCVVGSIEIVDYVEESSSPWFAGDLGIVVRNPIPFRKPIPCRGALGLFQIDTSGPAFQEQLRSLPQVV